MTREDIARVAHEINRAYCLAIGDDTQPEWDAATARMRDSARAGVEYHLGRPDASPADAHDKWVEFMEAEGWAYGPEKDVERKLHPCIAPYDALPAEQRAKDFLFAQVVTSLARFIL